ncbi:dTDP-4-dehydrorhamnose reductase [Undibacterium flavidum]|uniref:dTDP-4-dehydrorhamnose reductase n=1 Tax=Undibacterium flavidum TaxID=2762297 RepID=A0ABR6Y7S6_9BURK|nr:dTDP-4-dehydrorhamnose reductase [Undibacterium flavidum]MBC3872199.1 dTDP-4-dehydrorhamnose reductase [Undibacterium flavidum]
MRILLTGTSGQLGRSLAKALQDLGEVLTPQRAELDLSDVDSIAHYVQLCKPDLIINPAAYTAVDLAEKESELAFLVNAEAPTILAQEAKKLGIGLIHFSTDYVFDGSKSDANGERVAYTEEDACAPLNVYGASKLAGEQAIVNSGCAHLIFRTSWVYSDFGKNFLLTILRLAKEKTELNIVNDQWGTPSSTLFLSDAVKQVVLQLQSTEAHAVAKETWWQQHQGIYHLTPTGTTNWCEFSQRIVEHAEQLDLLSAPLPKIQGIPSSAYPTPAQRPKNSCLDKSKFNQKFGIQLPSWGQVLLSCLQGMASVKLQDPAN